MFVDKLNNVNILLLLLLLMMMYGKERKENATHDLTHNQGEGSMYETSV